MKNRTLKVLVGLCLSSFMSCSQNINTPENIEVEVLNQNETVKTEPHKYGGWYCPDNLNGFPAVDIINWENVPVVNGRMATKEETQNGTSLIFIDAEKYPHAKPLDIAMPKLASYYNENAKREEFIIVIQAIKVNNDSIVGFRYLNGGNGSARLKEVRFLSENEIEMIPASRYVSINIKIEATQEVIWKVITKPENVGLLQPIFDKDKKLKNDWRQKSNVNYHYPNEGALTSPYASTVFGNMYIQNDYLVYNEKILLLQNAQTKSTEMKMVFGPFVDNFETQKNILTKWAQKVKALSESELYTF